jgi:hypothetical protein
MLQIFASQFDSVTDADANADPNTTNTDAADADASWRHG